ncbi:MAG: stage II sporulation protein P [Oscillospiraceae bacterium]|nr:stage II sporulation protein P [Oscillospiraceae bacterium]
MRKKGSFRKTAAVSALLIAAIYMIGSVVPVSRFLERAALLSASVVMPQKGRGPLLGADNSNPRQILDLNRRGDDTLDDAPISAGLHNIDNIVVTDETAPQEQGGADPIEIPAPETEIISAVPLALRSPAHPIIRTTLMGGGGTNFIPLKNNTFINNLTSLANELIAAEAAKLPEFRLTAGDQPQVLIYHTHTTESFEDGEFDLFDQSYNYRSTDHNVNIVSVGAMIANQLRQAGIGVIHDTTMHDYPAYRGSYERSAITVQNTLKQYPSIKVVLDIHRDAIDRDNGDRVAPVANIGGKNAAQLMLISGCDNGMMNYPDYMKNLRFSSLVQQQIAADYPNLMRPVFFAYRKYNQDLSPGAFLVEVGSHGNSLEEALYAAELFGKSLVKTLRQLTMDS